MSRNPSKPVQMPGGATEAPATQSPAAQAPEAKQGADAAGDDALAQAHERLAALEAENARLKAAAKTAAPTKGKPTGTSASSHAHLPASAIDPDSIAAPVLSREGWVVPTPKTDNTRR